MYSYGNLICLLSVQLNDDFGSYTYKILRYLCYSNMNYKHMK